MPKLKELFEAVKTAEEKANAIMRDMTAALELGTEEGKQAALDMRPALDEARQAADEANLAYIAARDAEPGEDPNANARKFVPVQDGPRSQRAGTMLRSEFKKLSARDQMDFMLADGKLVDDEPQS